jgi:hypothetical protein
LAAEIENNNNTKSRTTEATEAAEGLKARATAQGKLKAEERPEGDKAKAIVCKLRRFWSIAIQTNHGYQSRLL